MGKQWAMALVLVLSVALLSSCGPGATQMYEDKEITVKSVQRESAYGAGMQQWTPEPGYEYAVVTFNIHWLTENGSLVLESADAAVVDVDGNEYGCPPFIGRRETRPFTSGDTEDDLVFLVKKGARLRIMKLKDVSFGIEGMEVQ